MVATTTVDHGTQTQRTPPLAVVSAVSLVVGICSIAAAYWEAVGPFAVSAFGASTGCGSPFLGRYIDSTGDPGAALSFLCLQASSGRRSSTFLLGSIGLILVLFAVAYLSSGGRASHELGPKGPSGRTFQPSSSGLALWIVVAGAISATAAAVLILGAVVATLRA